MDLILNLLKQNPAIGVILAILLLCELWHLRRWFRKL